MFETTATRQETRCLAHLCNSSSAPPTSFASRPAAYPIMTLMGARQMMVLMGAVARCSELVCLHCFALTGKQWHMTSVCA